MTAGKPRKQKTQKSRNPIKRRLELLEGLLGDGIDQLVQEVRRIDGNIMVLAHGMEDIDDNAAALRALCIEKGLFTDAEFDAKKQEIVDIRLKAREEAARKAEAEAAKEQEPEKEEDDTASRPDGELVDMHKKAVEAGQSAGVPDGAFIFGG